MLFAIRHRPFALIWTGQTVSRLGDSLYRLALSWWVLEKTGSATIMGTILIFSFLPMVVFSLFGGIAVDRFPRLKVMLLSDGLRGLAVAIVAALAFTDQLEIWHIYVASTLFGLVDAFFQPAYTAVVPEITPTDVLPGANSLTSLSAQFATIAGPAVGAALVSLGGTPFAFALDAASFFVSAACLLPLLKLPAQARGGLANLRIWQDLKVGFQAVAKSPWLWITILIAALSNVTLSGPYSVSLPFLVQDTMHEDVAVLSSFYSISSIGSVAAALWFGRYKRLRHRGLLGYAGWLFSGLAILIFGLPVPLAVKLGAALINGAMLTMFGLIWVNTLQELVPGELLGRVASIDNLGSYMLLPVGYGLAGILTDQLGPPLVFIGGGAITILLVLAGILAPGVRKLD